MIKDVELIEVIPPPLYCVVGELERYLFDWRTELFPLTVSRVDETEPHQFLPNKQN